MSARETFAVGVCARGLGTWLVEPALTLRNAVHGFLAILCYVLMTLTSVPFVRESASGLRLARPSSACCSS
jgi:hypothetical protein